MYRTERTTSQRLTALAKRVASRLNVEARAALWNANGVRRSPQRVRTKQGIFLLPPGSKDPISQSLFIHGHYELDFATLAMSFLRESGRCGKKGEGTLLDIGANNGVTSIGMLTAGEVRRAVALEPEPTNFARLQRNAAENGVLDRLLCLNVAAAASAGQLEMELSEENTGDHRARLPGAASGAPGRELYGESGRRTVAVSARTVDDILASVDPVFRDISVLWIDVQGFEVHAFRGATRLLERGVPVVSEFWPYGMRRAGVCPTDFQAFAAETWKDYWVLRNGRFVRYPVSVLQSLFDECGDGYGYTNILFTR